MKYNLYAILAAALCLLTFAGCQQNIDWVHDLENGDFSKVQFKRGPAGMVPIVPSGKADQYLCLVRDYFIEHQPVINTIAGQCPCVEPSPLDEFRLQGVWSDTLDGRLMVQFFAPYQQPRIFAGRRVQFLVDRDRRLLAIYVSDAPLETE